MGINISFVIELLSTYQTFVHPSMSGFICIYILLKEFVDIPKISAYNNHISSMSTGHMFYNIHTSKIAERTFFICVSNVDLS